MFHVQYKSAGHNPREIEVVMRFSIRFADKIVGAFIILALVILIAAVFLLGKSQRWFINDIKYKTYVSSASGVNVNMAVQYKGFQIGSVKKVSLNVDDNVEVIFTIFKEYNHKVTEGSMVEVQSSPIGLGNSFLFHPGKGTQTLKEDDLIPEITSSDAEYLIRMGLADAVDSNDRINNIISQVSVALETINKSIIGPNPGDPALAGIIGDLRNAVQTLNFQINPILSNIDSATGRISDPSNALMTFLADGNLYSDLSASLESVNAIMVNMEKTSEFLPSGFPTLMTDLNNALRTTQDVLVALTNNPLLRRGVPEHKETTPGGASPRNLDFGVPSDGKQ